MGMEITVARAEIDLAALLAKLAAEGFASSIMMVDNQLRMPNAAAPAAWHDVRLKTPGGTVTLTRRGGAIAVMVFGNADAALQEAQKRVAAAANALP